MASQQVFRLPQRNSIQDLHLGTEPIPSPSSYEVLIRIRSVALNFRDFAVAESIPSLSKTMLFLAPTSPAT